MKFDENTLWEKNLNLLIKYINSSEEIKENFKQIGFIPSIAMIEENGENYKIGAWLNNQRFTLMKKYHGMTIEEIFKHDNIPDSDKYRMKKILEIGVTYPKTIQQCKEEKHNKEIINWEEKFNLFIKYINSSDEIKKDFYENGRIDRDLIVENEGQYIRLGQWYDSQQNFLKQYYDRTEEDIKNDESISEKDKFRINKLRKVIIPYQVYIQEKNKEEWDRKFDILVEYINSSEKTKEYFMHRGRIKQKDVFIKDGKEIKIGIWLAQQRTTFMSLYKGKTIREIQNDKSISEIDKYKMLKLLSLGVSYIKSINGETIGKSTYSLVEKCDESQKQIESLKEKERNIC